MRSTRDPGRVAGLWYLLLVILGPLRLIYIPTKLFVHGNRDGDGRQHRRERVAFPIRDRERPGLRRSCWSS